MPNPKLSAEHHQRMGNYRDAHHGSPDIPLQPPTRPQDMSDEAKMLWEKIVPRLIELGKLTRVDQTALRMLCESMEIYLEAMEDIRNRGILVNKTVRATGNEPRRVEKVVNPSCKLRDETYKQILALLRQFGMTPISRQGMGPTKSSPDKTSDIARILSFDSDAG